MPREVVRKERGVFEKVPGSDIWWIRFKVAGVQHREKWGGVGVAMAATEEMALRAWNFSDW
jgi:hypothetical protein